MKYRKKPHIVEAKEFTGLNFGEIYKWLSGMCRGGGNNHIDKYDQKNLGCVFVINYRSGDATALPGDYIIKGVMGEFYVCKPDVFKMSYEEVIEDGTEH